MRSSDFKLGMRVRKRGNGSSFVPDRNPSFRPRRIGVVVGMPQTEAPQRHTVAVRWDGSDWVDHVPIHRLEQAPQEPAAAGPGEGTTLPAE